MKAIKRLLIGLLLISAFSIQHSAFAQTATFYVPNTTQVIPFSLTAAGAPVALAYGPVAIGANSGTQTLTLTNNGTANLSSISLSFSGGNTGDFSQTTSPATNCGTPLTPGSSCTITITFTPTAAGARATALSVASNITTEYIGVSGTGVSPLPGPSPAGQPVIAAAATLSPTCAQSGSMILFGQATGEVITLPAASAATVGCWLEFTIVASDTSNYNEIATTGSNYLLGQVQECATGIACLDFWADGTSIKALKMGQTTTLGGIGSTFTITGITPTQWAITGTELCSGTCVTAFTTTP